MVWLLTKNIRPEQSLKKLNHKIIGLYKVKKIVRSSYWLKLSISMRIHDVFFSSLLKKVVSDLLPGQINNLSLSVVIDDKKIESEQYIVRL